MPGIPAKVAEAAAEADRMQDQIAAAAQIPVETPAQPEAPAATDDPQSVPAGTAPVQADGTPIETPSDEGLQSRLEESNRLLDLEQKRHATLKSKYDREVPRLYRQIRELTERLDSLERRPAAPAVTTPETAPQRPDHLKLLSDDETKDLDARVLDLQARLARGVADAGDAKIMRKLTADIDAIKRMINQGKMVTLWDTVEKAHPGARAMDDTDANWHTFLESVDPLSGLSYGEIGESAIEAGNAERLIKLIGTYKAEAGLSDPGQVVPGVKPRTVRTDSPKQNRSSPMKRQIKESELTAFVSDYTKGVYKGCEAEAVRKQNEFDLAISEGRLLLGQ